MENTEQTSDEFRDQFQSNLNRIDFGYPIASSEQSITNDRDDSQIQNEAKPSLKNIEKEKYNTGVPEKETNDMEQYPPRREVSGSNCSEDSSSAAEDLEEHVVECACPKVNCQEKIIICLDLHPEMNEKSFRSRAGVRLSPMKLLKQALPIFFQTKRFLDERHEYALVLLLHEAVWVKDFTSDPREIVDFLHDLEDQTDDCDEFNLSSLFDVILNKVSLPLLEDPSTIPPPYIVRVILLYGRSHCQPVLRNTESLNMLQSSVHFFLDAFYLHKSPSEDNQCEAIFDTICNLDHKGLSYVFEVSKNTTKLFDYLAQLVAHPLQRPLQKDANYELVLEPFSGT